MTTTTTASQATEQRETAGGTRWFIRLGFSGFNLPANQVRGYASQAGAFRAHQRCGGRPPAGYGLDAEGYVVNGETGARSGARFEGHTADGLAIYSNVELD